MALLFGMTPCDISKVKTTLAVHVSLDLTNIYTEYSIYKIQNTSICKYKYSPPIIFLFYEHSFLTLILASLLTL